jgi:glycosyltransferase involved in cell wall biosynthesis
LDQISIALISGAIPKSLSTAYSSFVLDEVNQLVCRGIDVHAVRGFVEKGSTQFGIHYRGMDNFLKMKFILSIFSNRKLLYKTGCFVQPKMLVFLTNYAKSVSNEITNENLDLIHAHFAYPEGFVGLLAKKETRKPLVVTVHGVDVLVEPSIEYGARLDKNVNNRVKRVLQDADAVIVASNATFEAVNEIIEKDRIKFIPNGVNLGKFNPSLDCTYLREKLGVGNWSVIFSLRSHERVYGLEYLIRAAEIVSKQRDDVLFILGGDGTLRQTHEKLVTELGLRKKIIFTGKIAREEVPYYYCLSKIVVVPSVQEAFGLAVSEAMACEKPVIGSNLGGIRDQIVDGQSGFLVEPKSPIKIAEKILWLLANPDESTRMGLNGRKIVEEKFNIEKRIDKVIKVYKKVLMH